MMLRVQMFMDADPQCMYIDRDLFERTGGEEGRYPLVVRTMDLNDELGQISVSFRSASLAGARRCISPATHTTTPS